MNYILIILFLLSLRAFGQNPSDPQIIGYMVQNPNAEWHQMLDHVINQNNNIKKQNDELLDLFFQTIEADHQLNMKLPGKLMQLYVYNCYIGEFAGVEMDSLAKFNIIICDTCTGAGLRPDNNFVIDYLCDWINLNLVEWEITELKNAEAERDFYRALNMIHRGKARELNLL